MSTFFVGARKPMYINADGERTKVIYNGPGSSSLSYYSSNPNTGGVSAEGSIAAGESQRITQGKWLLSAGQSRVMVAEASSPGPVPSRIDLFGPRAGDGKTLPVIGSYGYPTAVTAGSWLLRADLITARVEYAFARVVWTPGHVDAGIRFSYDDSIQDGVPVNFVEVCEFTGMANAAPIWQGEDITEHLRDVIAGGAPKYFQWEYKAGGAVAPIVFHVGIEIVWGA